jgi:hypothetical protein
MVAADFQQPGQSIRPRKYCSSADIGDPTLADCLIGGSSNYIFTGRGRPKVWSGLLAMNGVTGSRALFNVSDTYAGLGDGATDGLGYAFSSIARAIFFGGQGDLRITGAGVRAAASTTMQLLLYRSGSYSGAGTGPYQVGLAQPSAPQVAARAPSGGTITGKLSGTYSIVITRVRSATGAESKASTSSAVFSADTQSVRCTLPALDSNGQDRWGIYCTKAGFGSAGPHYFLREISDSDLSTIDTVARSIELEWNDGDLFPIFAPLDNDPPPACVFGLGIEDITLGVGAYGDVTSGIAAATPGTCVVISLKLYPEAFPADNEHILFLPGPPTGVATRSARNYAFITGSDYLCAVTYTGGSPAVTLQLLWAYTGFKYEHNFCIAEDELFGYLRGRGAVSLGAGDDPDTVFAVDVSDELAGLDPADVFAGYDPGTQFVAYAAGRKIYCYMRQLEGWTTPLDASNVLGAHEVFCGRVTVGNELILATRDTVTTGAALKLWKLQGGNGTTAVALVPWQDAQGDLLEVFGVDLLARVDNTANDVRVDAYAVTGAIKTTTAADTKLYTPSEAAVLDFERWRCDLPAAKRVTFKVTITSQGGDAGLIEIRPRASVSGVPL